MRILNKQMISTSLTYRIWYETYFNKLITKRCLFLSVQVKYIGLELILFMQVNDLDHTCSIIIMKHK